MVIIFVSCSTNNYISPTTPTKPKAYNFASIYNPSNAAVIFNHNAYFDSDTNATVFFNISFNNKNFISRTNNPNDKKELIIRYILRDTANILCDSATIKYEINDYSSFSNNFSVKLNKKSEYRLTIFIFDNNRQFSQRIVSLLNNKKELSLNDFLLIDEKENIKHNKYVETNGKYIIISRKNLKLKVNYYSKKEYLLNPPYQININKTITNIPDTTFSYMSNDTLVFNHSGNYVFCDETTNQVVFNIISETNKYPNITTLHEMIDPLYLFTSIKIVNQIKLTEDVKTALDKYWLSLSKSQNLTKEQIRVFYRRVELANTYFTEGEEGWKSDRGMIYVIFGAPSVINLSDEGEEWYYGQDPNVAALLFVFEKIVSPNTITKFRLIRDNAYQPTWGQAISVWKKGRIYTL